ncbi:MAG: hypothetical protein CBB60_001025 [Armatimonadetes bacterium Cent15-Ar3]|nr:MAG: hypothetical protein CBB60_001025 [Armatimonadetes bacterium Cent15-Ar3]
MADMNSFMKRGGVVALSSIAIVSIVLAGVSQTVEPRLKKGSQVGIVDVGGLTVSEAQKKVRIWWEAVRVRPLNLKIQDKTAKETFTATQLGIVVDDVASVAQVPVEGVVGQVLSSDEKKVFNPIFKPNSVDLTPLRSIVSKIFGPAAPAKVKFVGGVIQKTPETPVLTLDEAGLTASVISAVQDDQIVDVPVKEAPKKLTDEVLAQITDVVGEFKTNFNAGVRDRSNNIRLATGKIDGTLLLPGERFSFNKTVGERTVKSGFREAPVFVNGRHETGVGGGICQVSTTLYNASLFANLKIVERTNHSLPVPYVPVGRDATVNWGAQDLVLENNMTTPIVLAAEYTPGTLRWRILGKKDPTVSVKISSTGVTTSSRGEKRQFDPTLPPGAVKVTERGSSTRSVYTFRHVFKNGVEVKKEPLGRSYYAGSPRIVAYGPNKPAAGAATTTAPPVTGNGGDEL